jgi:hypothetical protein
MEEWSLCTVHISPWALGSSSFSHKREYFEDDAWAGAGWFRHWARWQNAQRRETQNRQIREYKVNCRLHRMLPNAADASVFRDAFGYILWMGQLPFLFKSACSDHRTNNKNLDWEWCTDIYTLGYRYGEEATGGYHIWFVSLFGRRRSTFPNIREWLIATTKSNWLPPPSPLIDWALGYYVFLGLLKCRRQLGRSQRLYTSVDFARSFGIVTYRRQDCFKTVALSVCSGVVMKLDLSFGAIEYVLWEFLNIHLYGDLL